ncbi:MAG TPA: hypothetical protein DIT01_14465 [Lentisphaeria bacterium]|jgi:hypothetical protein|nr:hypothetical protein [Lentisphaeria bacterium]|tara:strand:+ start:4379 stop:4624 length:246 start_codon:yes stop_codon:yes gene_type:complete
MNSNPTFDTLLTTFPVPADDAISYRPAIFWAMNDKLERPVLEAQLDGFAKCGYGDSSGHKPVRRYRWKSIQNEQQTRRTGQ